MLCVLQCFPTSLQSLDFHAMVKIVSVHSKCLRMLVITNVFVFAESIYRRGARRWRKMYHVNGHAYQAKRFNRKAFCVFCRDRIWGLGRQGFKCLKCKLMVHKKCHKLYRDGCTGTFDVASGGNSVHSSESSPQAGHGIRTAAGTEMNGADITILSKDDIKLNNNRGHTPATHRRQHPPVASGGGVGHFGDEGRHGSGQNVDAITEESNGAVSSAHQYSIQDFELLRVIGRGSYAKVLMVELKRTKRIYAMKVIKKELVTDDEDIDWVQTEKHVFETASNYPFLVGLHSCFQTKSR